MLVHPDKNPNDVERAQQAFDGMCSVCVCVCVRVRVCVCVHVCLCEYVCMCDLLIHLFVSICVPVHAYMSLC